MVLNDTKITLERYQQGASETLGRLWDGKNKLCYTAELPWKDNKACISCVPSGTYSCIMHNSLKFSNVWELINVPNREGILIHSGNIATKDSTGCILVGNDIGLIGGYLSVLNSKKTLDFLRSILPSKFSLTIRNNYDSKKVS